MHSTVFGVGDIFSAGVRFALSEILPILLKCKKENVQMNVLLGIFPTFFIP
jgi:hypothetical protein